MVENILITMDMCKLTCPKWHFGQVRHGVKKLNNGSFWLIFPIKNVTFFCNVHILGYKSHACNRYMVRLG
jgi:hypothetical protein